MFVGVGLPYIQAAQHQSRPDVEKEIWQLEESYWGFWIRGDIESYLALLHEDFLGWPYLLEEPADKRNAQENFIAEKKPHRHELKPVAVGIISNVAVVHYLISFKNEDGKTIGNRYRVIHTWLKQHGKWQIVGGMSSKIS